MLRSFIARHWTGRDLLAAEREPAEVARRVYDAPFVVLSHSPDSDPDPHLRQPRGPVLFEATWDELTRMPSRLTAEAPDREERARLLAQVGAHGYIGRLLRGAGVAPPGGASASRGATVWNLRDEAGRHCGQAATFAEWHYL